MTYGLIGATALLVIGSWWIVSLRKSSKVRAKKVQAQARLQDLYQHDQPLDDEQRWKKKTKDSRGQFRRR